MKIIKSKYTSEELQRIYDEAESKVEKDVVKKINCLGRILDILYAVLAWISIGLIAGLFSFNFYTGKAVGNKVIVFLAVTAMAFILWFFVDHLGVSKLLFFRLYEKRGHILENPLDKHGTWFLIKLLDSCEEISEVMENLEGRLYSFKNNIFTVFEQIDDSQISLEIEIRVPNILTFEVYDENEDTLDFSCFDKEISEAIENMKTHIEVRNSKEI